ncbi:MAG: hypothetical protein GXO43_09810 [Crenarchaeota archaeon]|nr:hypothetical protein [Thermoproteota archaeon]
MKAQFLVQCSQDFLLSMHPTMATTFTYAYQVYNPYSYLLLERQMELVISSFEYASRLIVKSINARAEVSAGDAKSGRLVVKVNDSYEAFILALHLDLDKFYACNELICRIPPVSSLRVYSYGLRKIYQDIPDVLRLASCTNYIVLLDVRRVSGSIVAVFNELKRFHGVEPDEAILIAFDGLGEPIYETLGAYILRCRGYIVAHQALVSDLVPPPYSIPGVPDLELAYVGGKGAFLYELSILKYLGKHLKLGIVSTGVGEAKSSRYDLGQGLGQLHRYLESGFYEEVYLIVPGAIDRIDNVKREGIGIVTWDHDGTPIVVPSERRWGKKECVEAFKSILNTIVRMHINEYT